MLDNLACPRQVRVICSSPDGVLLLAIDEDGRCLLINKRRQALLHQFSFRGPVGAAKFSPDGRFIACGVGKVLQVGLPCGPFSAAACSHVVLQTEEWIRHVSEGVSDA